MIPLLRNLLSGIVKPYLEKNPTAVTALQLIRKEDPGPVCYDHFAFRTFGVSLPVRVSVDHLNLLDITYLDSYLLLHMFAL